jgi:hypothetical protein
MKDPLMGVEMLLPMSSEMRLSMELISSSFAMSDVLQLSRNLLVSRRACRKLGG